VVSVAFAPDGKTLATTSEDQTVLLRDLTRLNSLRADTPRQACDLAGGGLDHEEWARYISSLPYRDTCP
jgi:WD40 repeat protein